MLRMEILSSIACLALATQVYVPKIGERHPPLVLPSIESREPVALADFRGRRLLLIHFASW